MALSLRPLLLDHGDPRRGPRRSWRAPVGLAVAVAPDLRRGRPASVWGGEREVDRLGPPRRPDVVGLPCMSMPDGGSISVTFAPAGGVGETLFGRNLAVGDLGRLNLEHGLVVALRVDRRAQRGAADGVPGELGRAEQPAVVLRGDPHRVGRLPGGGRRLRAGERPRLAEPSEARLDRAQPRLLGLARLLLLPRAAARCRPTSTPRRRPCSACRRRRVGRRRVGLQLEPHPCRRWRAIAAPRRR